MKLKIFFIASIIFYSGGIALEAAKYVEISIGDFSSRHDAATHTLNLNDMGFTEDLFRAALGDIICFINSNKIEILLLEKNNFESPSIDLLRRVTGLLSSSTTLKTISLKNNFRHVASARGSALSPQAISQISSMIGQFQTLFKDSLTDAGQQAKTEYITKEILLDDMPPLSIIQEIKLPPTAVQKVRAFAVKFGVGLASLIVTAGGTILTIYLSGKFGCNCPSSAV
jgi:hypothetical protein